MLVIVFNLDYGLFQARVGILVLLPENASEELLELGVFLLVAYTHAVALGEIQVAGVLVGRVGEEVEAELALRVELDLYVQVAYHIPVARTVVVFAVGDTSADYYPVVEELGGNCHVEDIVAVNESLITYTHVDRNLQLLKYGVELVGHQTGDVG